VPTIVEVIAEIPAWSGRSIEAAPVPGGLTNPNYRVVVDGTPYFVRIPGPSTHLLEIDRSNEAHNTRAAAAAGVGPQVIYHLPAMDVLILEWLPARTMSNETLSAPEMPGRVAETLRRLHAGPRFKLDFNMFDLSRRYLAVVDQLGATIPTSYREHLPLIPRIEAVLAARPLPSVPCHNDLLAENYLDDGTRLWIVDYEYSGNGDPTFELGNTCQELGFDDVRTTELCAAYFGEATPTLLARMRLQMIISDVGWTLWAAIQARVSTIDYDFTAWVEERWARAATALDGPDFAGWLAAAAGG
jgi:thiamine kinase-like enzyme